MKITRKYTLAILLFLSLTKLTAQTPQGTAFLNPDNFIGSFKDKEWYKSNIPFLEVPDVNIQQIYYYRWFTYYTNLRYTNPETGYIVTEFSQDVSWQTRFGGIVCAAGHHFYEGRWLKNQRYMTDLANYWGTGVGAPRSRDYTFWKADAYYARYMVSGDVGWIKNWYQPLVDNYNAWNRNFNPDMGLYWREGVWDGMELSATSLQSPSNEGVGYRPTINSYLYGDALAISKIAFMSGNMASAGDFNTRAQNLKKNLHEKLWDNSATFFKHKFRDEVKGDLPYPANKYYPKESFVDAREEYDYTPWYMNMVEDDPKYIAAWNFLFDAANGFYSNYGPTTLEKSHRLYRYQDQNCCHWDGMSWPFSTSQTLLAIANVLNNYQNKGILNKDRYFDILKKYTLTQYKNGIPYIAEAHDPEQPVWTYDLANRSQHYNHSSYNDLIITGLLGLRPRADNILEVNPMVPDSWNYFLLEDIPYHGHLITLLYDRNGGKYNQGAGFKIFLNGKLIHEQASISKALVPIPSPDLSHNYGFPHKENYASNPDKTGYPTPSASYVSGYDNIWDMVDGRVRFEENPKSRVTTYDSGDQQQWFAIDYGAIRTINRIDLMIYEDTRAVRVPASYNLQYWNGSIWIDIPQQNRMPANPVNDRNTIRFPEISTTKVRVVMQTKPGYAVGLTELETWMEIQPENIGTGNGLAGTYFNGRNFESPRFNRIDEKVQFNWANGTPDSSIAGDGFSVRWQGQIQPHFSELYTFHIQSDNGRRLWINNQLIIDKWVDDWDVDYTGQISLEAGKKYAIKIEYFENFGGANIDFKWESASQFLETVPQSQLYGILDFDADGIPDDKDECPKDSLKADSGICGCGVSEDCIITALGTQVTSDPAIYPNPFEGRFFIRVKGAFSYSIYNIQGILVEQGEGKNELMAGGALSKGSYTISLRKEDHIIHKVIIKY